MNMNRINSRRQKGSTSITTRLGLAGGLIGLILRIHQDGETAPEQTTEGDVYASKDVLEIQSTTFFNTYSRLSANINTASIGKQSGLQHIVVFVFFLFVCFCTRVSKQN